MINEKLGLTYGDPDPAAYTREVIMNTLTASGDLREYELVAQLNNLAWEMEMMELDEDVEDSKKYFKGVFKLIAALRTLSKPNSKITLGQMQFVQGQRFGAYVKLDLDQNQLEFTSVVD